jgi:hypothetical protein
LADQSLVETPPVATFEEVIMERDFLTFLKEEEIESTSSWGL